MLMDTTKYNHKTEPAKNATNPHYACAELVVQYQGDM